MKISELERTVLNDARDKVDGKTFSVIVGIPSNISESHSYYMTEFIDSIEDPELKQSLYDYIILCIAKYICQAKLKNNFDYCLKCINDLKDRYDVSDLCEQFLNTLFNSINQENLEEMIDYAYYSEQVSSISNDQFKSISSLLHIIIYPKVLKAFHESTNFFNLIKQMKKLHFEKSIENNIDNIFFTYIKETLKFLINIENNSLHLRKVIKFAKKHINEQRYAELKKIFRHSLYIKFLSISENCPKKDQTIKSLKKPEDDNFEAVVVLSEKQTYFRYCFKDNEKNKMKIIKEISFIYDFINTLGLSRFQDLFTRSDNEHTYMSIEFPFKLHGIDKDFEIRKQENRFYTHEEFKKLLLDIAKIGYEAEKLGQELKFYPSMFLVDQSLNVITFPESIISRTYYKKFGVKDEADMQSKYKHEEGRIYEYCLLAIKIKEVSTLQAEEIEKFDIILQEIYSNGNIQNWHTTLEIIKGL